MCFNVNFYFAKNISEPKISLGICLPANCSVTYFESIVNDVIDANAKNIVVTIPNDTCQFEENKIHWNTIDFVTM